MKKNILVFTILIISIQTVFSQVAIKKKPNWVTSEKYNHNPSVSEDEISQGLLTLLYEEQINIDIEEYYIKSALKVTENVGAQPASNISVNFDPSYQKLTFHSINIIREGKIINKLLPNSFQTMRRELSAENYIYDGSLSAVTNLSDIRMGDIVEYSYTIKGFNPIHKDHFASTINLRTSTPVGKLYLKLVSREKLLFKYFKTAQKIQEKKINNKYVYTFKEEDIPAYKYEIQTPVWHIGSGIVNVSNYSSWKEVVDWGVDVYKYDRNLSQELLSKIEKIKKSNKTEGERIKACLDFVQDEVRYLGLESGIGAYKPNSPNKVFEQLFGDCKDKSMLFVAMLRAMNINAYPALINTYLKGTLKDFLPSPYQFNHCVTKVITSDGGEYWYDPTISNQGGQYTNVAFPDYRLGLVLKKGNEDLEEIFPFDTSLIEITDNFILEEVGKGATLSINSVYKDASADNMRSYFKNNSISSINKEYENYYSKYFNNIRSTKKPEFNDDIENNIFTINEEYKIDSIWKPSILENHLALEFYPYSIIDILSLPGKANRKQPFAMLYPATRNHVINVKLPHEWSVDQRGVNINSPNLYYDFEIAYLPKEFLLTLNHSLKIQKDHVSTEEFPRFYQDMKKLDTRMGYSLVIPKDGNSKVNSISSSTVIQILGALLFWGLIAILIWLSIKIYKYDPTPKLESYFEENKSIGGWLIAVGIYLFLFFLFFIFSLIMNNLYITGKWLILFTSQNPDFTAGLGLLIFIELIVNAILCVAIPLAIFLFLKRRSSFPKFCGILLTSYFIFTVIDYFIANSLEAIPFFLNQMYINKLQIMFISVAIIVPYILFSDEAKETFVQRLKK